jgi:hypothetical protein
MENVGRCNAHLENIRAILLTSFDCHLVILWKFGMYIFPRFGTLSQEKSGNPAYIKYSWVQFPNEKKM